MRASRFKIRPLLNCCTTVFLLQSVDSLKYQQFLIDRTNIFSLFNTVLNDTPHCLVEVLLLFILILQAITFHSVGIKLSRDQNVNFQRKIDI